MTEPRLTDFLGHIVVAIERILKFTESMDGEQFAADLRTQDAVLRNLEVIGEAGRRIIELAPDFVASHPELPLREAYRMRNALAHGYFSVNIAVVWRTIQADLPSFADRVRVALDDS